MSGGYFYHGGKPFYYKDPRHMMKRPAQRSSLRDPASIPDSVVAVYARMQPRSGGTEACREFLTRMPDTYYRKWMLLGQINELVGSCAGETRFDFEFPGETRTLIIGVEDEDVDWFAAEHFDAIRAGVEALDPGITGLGIVSMSEMKRAHD